MDGLAAYLLDHLPGGGPAFISGLNPPGANTVKTVDVAYKVLQEYAATKGDEARGGKLFEVLNNNHIDPSVAEQFKERLIPRTPLSSTESGSTRFEGKFKTIKKKKEKKNKKDGHYNSSKPALKEHTKKKWINEKTLTDTGKFVLI